MNLQDVPAAAWAAIAAILGSVGTFVARRGPDRMAMAATLNERAMAMFDELQEEVTRHSRRIETLEAEVKDCEDRYANLQHAYTELRRSINGDN